MCNTQLRVLGLQQTPCQCLSVSSSFPCCPKPLTSPPADLEEHVEIMSVCSNPAPAPKYLITARFSSLVTFQVLRELNCSNYHLNLQKFNSSQHFLSIQSLLHIMSSCSRKRGTLENMMVGFPHLIITLQPGFLCRDPTLNIIFSFSHSHCFPT
jgi:hypothetical protein